MASYSKFMHIFFNTHFHFHLHKFYLVSSNRVMSEGKPHQEAQQAPWGMQGQDQQEARSFPSLPSQEELCWGGVVLLDTVHISREGALPHYLLIRKESPQQPSV